MTPPNLSKEILSNGGRATALKNDFVSIGNYSNCTFPRLKLGSCVLFHFTTVVFHLVTFYLISVEQPFFPYIFNVKLTCNNSYPLLLLVSKIVICIMTTSIDHVLKHIMFVETKINTFILGLVLLYSTSDIL